MAARRVARTEPATRTAPCGLPRLERAGAMTATVVDITCGSFLDEQAMPGRRVLNDRARPVNA